jgi:hypothetical protein
MKTSSKWLIFGGIFIALVGTVLHFAFSSTKWIPIGLFAPVNESPWEHLKLVFWPAMLILIFEYLFVYKKDPPNNFFLAKTVGIMVMPIVILGIFYIYTAFLGTSILIIDITSFYISIVVGLLVNYKIYNISPVSDKLNKYSSFILVIFAVIIIVFTFYPPHIPLFYDSEAGGYGIIFSLV